MNKEKFGLIGGGFHHAFSSTLDKHPMYFDWDKGNKNENVTFYIDEAIMEGINDSTTKRKFAWVVESRLIIPRVLDDIKSNWKIISESYECLFTHHKEIYDLAENFIYEPPHGYWIDEPKIYGKSKLVSMMSSTKNMGAGHGYRLKWVNKLKNQLYLYGRGFNTINKKEEALRDYMFSVTIENDSYPTYWSEKILDCFACGTIPVYHGSPDINEHFNMDGIIVLTDDFNVNELTPELYYSKMDAIKDNFERTLKFNVIEDIIYEKYIKK
jgi:hypothetical protein